MAQPHMHDKSLPANLKIFHLLHTAADSCQALQLILKGLPAGLLFHAAAAAAHRRLSLCSERNNCCARIGMGSV